MEFNGGCHCGNLALALRSAQSSLAQRRCACSFCRAHDARYVSDPAGAAQLRCRDSALLARYRFGQHSADFLFCARCGVYLGAAMQQDGRDFMVINVRALGLAVEQDAALFDFDGESREQRDARRRRNWTPLTTS